MGFLEKWQPQLLALLRIMSGLLFVEHGMVKLLHFPHVPTFDHITTNPILMVAGTIELVGGALVTLGLWSRYAAFIMSGEMAVAYFMVHAKQSFYPALNMGESAILFCFVFLYLASAGPGAWSLSKQ